MSGYDSYSTSKDFPSETTDESSPTTTAKRQTDWHARFVSASAIVDEETRNAQLTQLATDFINVASVYGRIIISELFSADRTLGQKDVGGVAGLTLLSRLFVI